MSDTRVSVRPYMVGPAATHFVVPTSSIVPPTIDGTPVGNITFTTVTFPLTFSTIKTNDICILHLMINAGTITSVIGTTLTWVQRGFLPNNPQFDQYYALSPSILTNEVVTVTVTGTPTMSGIVFAVNGCDISSEAAAFDAASPVTNTSGTPSGQSTIKPATMAIAGFRGNGDGAVASGWTSIGNNRGGLFMDSEYKTFTSTQTGTVACADTMTGINGWIYDVLKSAGQ